LSWQARATCITEESRSQSLVEPSNVGEKKGESACWGVGHCLAVLLASLKKTL
jgi:hypothetical protein